MTIKDIRDDYLRDGYASPVAILTPGEAQAHRDRMQWAERQLGPLHYVNKVHTILRSPYELATHPKVLDVVEAILGPDLLIYNATYIVKEPRSPAHVSWHQDLTYWGLSSDDQVSLWLALSPANAESGCMRMIPGSHKAGRLDHTATEDRTNVLSRGQTVRGIDEAAAALCPLAPGEASFHHGWTLHASMPNQSSDRRIGLNVQYLATNVRQLKAERDTAMLVRGADRFCHFEPELPPQGDLNPAALARQKELAARYLSIIKS